MTMNQQERKKKHADYMRAYVASTEERRQKNVARARQWQIDNPERYKERMRRHYDRNGDRTKRRAAEAYVRYQSIKKELAEAQNLVCVICDGPLGGRNGTSHGYLDHDHVTGQVRGCLCNSCNVALGAFHTKELLDKAMRYLGRCTGYIMRSYSSINKATE